MAPSSSAHAVVVPPLDPRLVASVDAYDEHARAYQQSYRRRRPTADVHRFAAMANKGDLVLDAGCGPASDMRLLRDAGLHAVGVDLSKGNLEVARMLLPRDPLVRARYDMLPFKPRSFNGLWLSGSLDHTPRDQWETVLDTFFGLLAGGPVYFQCVRGNADMAKVEHPVLGTISRSSAGEREVGQMLAARGVYDLSVELRPAPLLDRRQPMVVALGRVR